MCAKGQAELHHCIGALNGMLLGKAAGTGWHKQGSLHVPLRKTSTDAE